MLDTVKRTISDYMMLETGENVLVALSGGADSTALLLSLRELGYPVRAFHLNHCLRGAESDRDEAFCQAHPTFTFDTLYETATWQVAAVLDTALGADELPYYTFFDADTKLDWQHRVRAITEKALYDTGVMPEYGAQLLTLSTCGDTHPDTDARFALLAVRID